MPVYALPAFSVTYYSIAPEYAATALAALATSHNVDSSDLAALSDYFFSDLFAHYYGPATLPEGSDKPLRGAIFITQRDNLPQINFYTPKSAQDHFSGCATDADITRAVYVEHIGCDTIAVSDYRK